MKGYCENCQMKAQGKKKAFSWGSFFLLGGIFYAPYRLLVGRNRCPQCGLPLKKESASESIAKSNQRIKDSLDQWKPIMAKFKKKSRS